MIQIIKVLYLCLIMILFVKLSFYRYKMIFTLEHMNIFAIFQARLLP
jgi:hypothetical protein